MRINKYLNKTDIIKNRNETFCHTLDTPLNTITKCQTVYVRRWMQIDVLSVVYNTTPVSILLLCWAKCQEWNIFFNFNLIFYFYFLIYYKVWYNDVKYIFTSDKLMMKVKDFFKKFVNDVKST